MISRRFPIRLLTCAALLAAGAERARASTPAWPSTRIIGGSVETGWPAVGALLYEGYPVCTATLIGSQWVLTAAHCVHPDSGSGFSPTPQTLAFFVGSDVSGLGTVAQVATVHEHPSAYPSQSDAGFDLALVALSAPVVGVEPIPINAAALGAPQVGATVTYVGFGTRTGYVSSDGGIKSSATLKIVAVESFSYLSESTPATGVCAGDSGGPGLLQMDGVWKVIGVTSTYQSDGADPCLNGVSIQMRPDYAAAWIADVMATQATDCRMTATLCACAEACQGDGTCDDAACPLTCVPAAETCDDGVDNDCDGEVDEGCAAEERHPDGGGGCSAGGAGGSWASWALLPILGAGARARRRRG